MAPSKTDIHVYADWKGMSKPTPVGILSVQQAKRKKALSFAYDEKWLQTEPPQLLDPDVSWFRGTQYPGGKDNFGMIMDSMPDTWGRTLMKRREALLAKEENRTPRTLYEIDYLLGVQDETRMGALRFKHDAVGDFLNNDPVMPTPLTARIHELQHAARVIEEEGDDAEVKKWLAVLLAPGSSLGGARPKANVRDEDGNLWIAKFPSSNDTIDKGAWEYLAYLLAKECGVVMHPSRIEKIAGRHHTFLTKRFDRKGQYRIHFASAMTMTGFDEARLRDDVASYLDIAEFLQYNSAQNTSDLHQLWRRIIFHIAISNTDDHLRNHGFLLTQKGWTLSPAYDLNPSIDKTSTALNIDSHSNELDIDLAYSVGEYFQLSVKEMDKTSAQVKKAVGQWTKHAQRIGISSSEQEMMAGAFRF